MTKASGKPRGFAAISPERRKEIASAGGKAAHAAGTAHVFSSAEAKAAGRRGGLARGRLRCSECGKVPRNGGGPCSARPSGAPCVTVTP